MIKYDVQGLTRLSIGIPESAGNAWVFTQHCGYLEKCIQLCNG